VSPAAASPPSDPAMTAVGSAEAVRELVARRLVQRREIYERWFGARAEPLARLCHAMAERFARGGRLLAIGVSPTARSDVRHVAVEFVHPVIVGKRALPALGLVGDSAPVATEVRLAAGADDIVMAFGDEPELSAALGGARDAGALTVAFAPLHAEWELPAPVGNPFIAQELVETAYHVLWELVHVFFEHRGLLAGRTERRAHDAGAASFLYPFLTDSEDDLDAVLADVAGSALLKAREICDLREATLAADGAGVAALSAAAAGLRGALDAGGRLLALGNGGSATDATDIVADFAMPPAGAGWPERPALDLTADAAILTAVANDIGVEAIFARQIIAHGRAGDVVLALSTSGSSVSVLDALGQARRQGMTSIALTGYDGGQIGADELADHVIVCPSQHIPRIQEAQATVYHLLRELVER
jgi:D-sedoheptulose 7-phosphate isomerase